MSKIERRYKPEFSQLAESIAYRNLLPQASHARRRSQLHLHPLSPEDYSRHPMLAPAKKHGRERIHHMQPQFVIINHE